MQNEFSGGGNEALTVSLFWGIKDLDLDGYDHWDSEFIGKAVWDDKFSLSSKDA